MHHGVPMHSTDDDIITTSDACEIHGVNRSTITRWVQAGRLVPLKKLSSGAYLFLRKDVLAVESRRRPTDAA